jgi:signal peptidase I
MSRSLGQEVSRIAVLFSSLYCIQEYGIAVSMTVGPSMMPTFNAHGDIVIVNRSKQARQMLPHPRALPLRFSFF